jgi:hypothetical protein
LIFAGNDSVAGPSKSPLVGVLPKIRRKPRGIFGVSSAEKANSASRRELWRCETLGRSANKNLLGETLCALGETLCRTYLLTLSEPHRRQVREVAGPHMAPPQPHYQSNQERTMAGLLEVLYGIGSYAVFPVGEVPHAALLPARSAPDQSELPARHLGDAVDDRGSPAVLAGHHRLHPSSACPAGR